MTYSNGLLLPKSDAINKSQLDVLCANIDYISNTLPNLEHLF